MKTRYAKLAVVVLLIVGTIACDKETDMSGIDFSNIENLYVQPWQVIQKAIQGKWKVVYAKGGLSANHVDYFENCFVEFTEDYKYISSNAIRKDTAQYSWIKESGKYMYLMVSTPVDSLFIMQWNGNTGEGSYVMNRIHNDTLIYQYPWASETVLYHCFKSTDF